MQHGDFSPAMLQCRKCLAAYGSLQSPLAPVLEVTAPQVEEQEEEWAPPSPAQPGGRCGMFCGLTCPGLGQGSSGCVAVFWIYIWTVSHRANIYISVH